MGVGRRHQAPGHVVIAEAERGVPALRSSLKFGAWLFSE